jgi:molecular chaperone DnaK (HSP70)
MQRYRVGIDLGTTNTVVAYTELGDEQIRLLDIEQLVSPGAVAALPQLPSVRYQLAEAEMAAAELQLPWPQQGHNSSSGGDNANGGNDSSANAVIGKLARKLGAQVPGRLVASAKSWLSHPAVDRLAPILPWGAAADVAKISPVAASASYLAYVRAAWDWRFPDHPLAQQELVLTVPASFDEGARALTLQAAHEAGLPHLHLLEEPQAVFYDWLYRHREDPGAALANTKLVLICDVGGGTTDISLIRIDQPNALQDNSSQGGTLQSGPSQSGQPQLTRIGVGNHLMLGGDNMDLALAHLIEARMMGQDGKQNGKPDAKQDESHNTAKLSASRLSQLIERCRAAKELLLSADAPERTSVTLLGGGSKLIGGSRSVELTRAEVEHLIIDGFFPLGTADEQARRGRSGIVEFGLPYASDPAITRHLASFLHQHAQAIRAALADTQADDTAAAHLAIPDALLLNGGVFRAARLAERLQHTLAAWRGAPLHLLHNDNPDVAVARGAVAYALARHGKAPKIGGGAARSYFLVLDQARSKSTSAQSHGSTPTPTPTQRAICILPRGSDIGSEIVLEQHHFALRLGQPVRFHLVSSIAQAGSAPAPGLGQIVELDADNFVHLPPLATVLQAGAGGTRQEIPVRIASTLTEVGTLELACVAINQDHAQNRSEHQSEHPSEHPSATPDGQRWRLQFQLRDSGSHGVGDDGADGANGTDNASAAPGLNAATEKIERIFGGRAQQVTAKEVKQLRAQLEQILGSRERWPTPLLRQLFDALLRRARGRRRSVEHERVWLNLCGYCLRPGFGYPLDDWRISQLWPLFAQGVQHGKDSQVCSEWWTMWRRVSGGLDATAQLRLLDDFALNVQGSAEDWKQRPPATVLGSHDDMLKLGASLERIPANYKAEIGAWLLTKIAQSENPDAAGTAPNTGNASNASNASEAGRHLWALARIGARLPFYGSAHDVVGSDIASDWLEAILALDWRRIEPAAFAAAHIARMSGDRTRDVSPVLREQIIRRLTAGNAAPNWIEMVREVVQLDEANQRRMLGDALPPGLKLIAAIA